MAPEPGARTRHPHLRRRYGSPKGSFHNATSDWLPSPLALSFALYVSSCHFSCVYKLYEPGMATNPWDPVQPTAAALLIERCLGAGVLSQKALDQTWKETPCFSRVEELEKISALKAEINQKSLELEMLQLEKETADITHSFYLNQKYEALQAINSHLEAVLREKRSLRQRLIKPLCQENLPIEAAYHRFVSELLPLAVNFIEKLEVYIQNIRTIPQIPERAKNMDDALVRMEALEADLEQMTEQILTWREKQNKLLQGNFQGNAEESSSSIKETTSYLSIENLHRQ
ncbi:HAUS augmin-like complex subunit 2 [Dendropsophus ebraccatus]|uniref:HAUS augmin-like complex subunit 2 n=1 Tax=Dendropsophus ebraccatus TaxID=150705 RepID=UPI003831163B